MTPKNFSLTNTSKFPSGSTVDAYAAGGYDFFPGLTALGSPADSQTATASGTSFSLEPGRYFFVKNGSDPLVYVTGTVGADGSGEGAAGLNADLSDSLVVGVSLGTPAVADDDYWVTSASMKATAYTIAGSALTIPRNVTVTHTATSTADTFTDAVVTGTNADGEEITESIAISSGGVATGTKCFKTVTEVLTSDWVVAAGADSIKVGFGNRLGLDRCLDSSSQIFLTFLAGVGVLPTGSGVDSDEIEKNYIDLSGGTYNGTKTAKALLIP